jgi:hypothetical protein
MFDQYQPHVPPITAPLWDDIQAALALVSANGEHPCIPTPPHPITNS